MEFLRFIFSSFWVWLGFMCMVVAFFGGTQELVKVGAAGMAELVKICKRNRKVSGYRVGERWRLEIEDASSADAQNAFISVTCANAEYEPEHEQEGETGDGEN